MKYKPKETMKWIFILALIACFGVFTSAEAQISAADSITADAGEVNTLFNTNFENVRNGKCSLIQRDDKDRKIYTYKNGYRIVTEEDDEVVEVRHQKNGGNKLRYYNGYETLKYHAKDDGSVHYKYSYYNECDKVKVRLRKNGELSIKNTSGEVEDKEVLENLNTALEKGVNTCTVVVYSK